MIQALKRAYSYKDLLFALVHSEIKSRHRDKVLGLLWTILDPMMLMLVYLFLVMVVFAHNVKSFPLYLYIGLISWRYLSICILSSTTCFTTNRALVMQAYFPRVMIPLIQVLSSAYDFIFSCIGLVFLYLVLREPVTPLIFLVVIVFIAQTLFNFGLALIFSILGLVLSDLNNIMKFVLRLGWYLSPGMYAISRIPHKYQLFYMANPMACYFEIYRDFALYHTWPSLGMMAYALAWTLGCVLIGLFIFIRGRKVIIKRL